MKFVFLLWLCVQALAAQTDETGYFRQVQQMFSEGRYQELVAWHDQCRPNQPLHDSSWMAIALVAKSHFYLGDNNRSDSIFHRLTSQKRLPANLRLRSLLEHSLLLSEMARFEEAQAALDEVNTTLALGDRELRVRYHNYLGVLQLRKGRRFDARWQFLKALMLADSLGIDKLRSFVLSNLAIVCRELGRHAEAIEFCRQSTVLDSLRRDTLDLAADEVVMGNIYNDLDDLGRSEIHYERAWHWFRTVGDSMGMAAVELNRATVYQAQSRFLEASDSYRQVISTARKNGDPLAEAHALQNLANVHMKSSRWPEALPLFTEALDRYRRLENHKETAEVIIRIAETYFHLGRLDSVASNLRQVEALLEYGDLGPVPWRIHHQMARIARWQNEVAMADSLYRLACLEAKPDPSQSQASSYVWEGERSEVYRDYIGLLLSQNRTAEALNHLHFLRSATWRPSTDRLAILGSDRPDTLIHLHYFINDSDSYAIVTSRGDTLLAKLASEKDLIEGAVEMLTVSRLSSASIVARQNSQRLAFELFVAPVWHRLGGESVWVIVPDGIVSYLPFDLMWTGDAFLINRHHVVFSAGKPGSVAEYGGSQAVFVGGNAGLGHLPFVADEERVVLTHQQVVWNRISTEEALKKTSLGRIRALHVAAHGVSNVWRPEQSYLSIDAGSGEDDGLWTAEEIRMMDLAGAVVVLSSCGSAVGRNLRAGGVQGLAAAFLDAGASAVVGTLWPVEDKASADFMNIFYSHWFGEWPCAAMEALARSKRELLAKTSNQGTLDDVFPYVIWVP